jgi:protein-S-isoprenylcysteine O-methyltransferase Ste14
MIGLSGCMHLQRSRAATVEPDRRITQMSDTTSTDNAGVVAPAPVFFGIGIAAGFLLESLLPTSLVSVPFAAAIGALLISCSVALVLAAVVSLLRAGTAFDARKPTTRLVTTGAFKLSRNPTYLSLALLHAGLAFVFQSIWLLGTAAVAIAITHWGVILREERYLGNKFGEEYRRYAERVRRWL